MTNKQFQRRLRREILYYSAILIAAITFLLSVSLFIFNRITVNYQIQQTREAVTNLLNPSISFYSEELNKQRDNLYVEFLEERVSQSTIYSNFYTLNSSQSLKGELLLLDADFNYQFTSNNRLESDSRFQYYLSLVAADARENGQIVQRIYRDRNQESNLLLVTEIGNQAGFAVYLFDGTDVRSQLNQVPADFVIHDKFDNVFSSSSEQFLVGSLNKLDSALFENRFRVEDDVYYSKDFAITSDLSLFIYQKGSIYPSLIRISTAIVLLLMIILALFASWYSKRISTRNARSVELLSNEMSQLKENPNHFISLDTNDEFEVISNEINKMVEELSYAHANNIHLLKENLLAEKKKLEAEFNPHFLYNTLEIIRATISFDAKLANELILRLTKILRYSIEEQKEEVTLRTDLEYLKEYLTISKIRFEAFDYEIQIEEAVLDMTVPKLFLLPLIENSLKYGFQLKQDLWISLTGFVDVDGTVILAVQDDGGAICEDRAAKLDHALQTDTHAARHHGLTNSKRRIQLLYPGADFHIGVYDGKTVVTIRIGVDKDV